MNTEGNHNSDENNKTMTRTAHRKGPRVVARTLILVVGLVSVIAGSFYLAKALRNIVIATEVADGGEWATLLGGGLGVWAFFLVRSGIIQDAFDLVPKMKTVVASLPSPAWSTYFDSAWDLAKTLIMPCVVTVFAMVFVGEHIVDQVTDPQPSPLAAQIDELRTDLGSRLDRIEGNIEDTSTYMAAMETQGYTTERAQRLDRISTEPVPTDYYFARFPISFGPGSLNDEGTTFVSGAVYDPVRNLDIVARLVDALIQCGSVDDPVRLRVEGYASSERFTNTMADGISDDLNLRLANERRRSVKSALVERIAAVGTVDAQRRILVVEADDYHTIDEMEADREFNDRPRGEGPNRRPQDFLTRAAHVKVMSPGTCRVRSG